MTRKVVQLTDTHLFRDPGREQKGVNTNDSLAAVVAAVARDDPDFDALLLTGDLSQDETPESYDRLADHLSAIRRDAPTHAIPGNHEDLAHMRERLGAAGIAVLEDLVLAPWRFVMLNTRVPGSVHGEVGVEQIRHARRTAGQWAGHVMVAMHHPPVAVRSEWIDALGCVDGDQFLEAIAGPPVKAVLCGHVHQVFETTCRETAILTSPSTCVQFRPGAKDFAIDDAPPGYRVLHLEDDGRWSTEVRRIEVA